MSPTSTPLFHKKLNKLKKILRISIVKEYENKKKFTTYFEEFWSSSEYTKVTVFTLKVIVICIVLLDIYCIVLKSIK